MQLFFSRNRKQKTCAIVQLEAVHEEVIPSLVRSLNAAGYHPHVYVNQRCEQQRGDIFRHVEELRFQVSYVPVDTRPDWNRLSKTIKAGHHDFLVMSTYQRDGVAAWAAGIGIPVLGVVHNVNLFLRAETALDAFKSGKAKVVCLAPHVAAYLQQRVPSELIDDICVVESVYWGKAAQNMPQQAAENKRRAIAVPGGVSFKSRAFEALVETLAGPADKELRGQVLFHILGGGEDRKALEALVAERGVSESFAFAPLGASKRVLYDDYVKGLLAADILHPLAPMSFSPYREHKITSAVPTAAGFGLPLILDRWTARVYRAPYIETDHRLSDSIAAAIGAGDETLNKQRSAMAEYRNHVLDTNDAEMGRLVGRL